MIPPDKTAAVTRALTAAFGTAQIDSIQRLTNGLSSDLIYCISINGGAYLLRIMTRTDSWNDPVRIFSCMRTAADADIAPRIHYSSAEDGVAILDFIQEVPWSPRQALAIVPETLRRLHQLPPFPTTFNYVTAHNGFVWKLPSLALLAQDEISEVFEHYEQICSVYPYLEADLVSSHMDLKPENILFDGRRVWLIDWMAASRNDRYFDLAVIAPFIVCDDVEEREFLASYLGQPPDDAQLARLFLMRQVLHLLAAAVFLGISASAAPQESSQFPSFREFHDRIWAGEIDLSDDSRKRTYGYIHWRQLQHNFRLPRFAQSLAAIRRTFSGSHLLLPKRPV